MLSYCVVFLKYFQNRMQEKKKFNYSQVRIFVVLSLKLTQDKKDFPVVPVITSNYRKQEKSFSVFLTSLCAV